MSAPGSSPASRLAPAWDASAVLDQRPGRTCPVSYRYSARVFDRAPEIVAETLYVVGGLYGNVETEISGEDGGAGCGCAYPAEVSDALVRRSNEILARLRETARGLEGARERLAALPMHLVARVGSARVGIVHGDAVSLAGWGFDRDRLADPSHRRWVESMLAQA